MIDVHALRHTFGTMLAKAGVSLQVAQRAMRHSTPTLTANVYTHLGLLDVADAVSRLPVLEADMARQSRETVNSVAPNVAPTADKTWCNAASSGNLNTIKPSSGTADTDRVLANKDKALQEGAREMNGGRSRTRTCDPLRVRQEDALRNSLSSLELQKQKRAVAPNVAPPDAHERLDDLRTSLLSLENTTLVELLAELLRSLSPDAYQILVMRLACPAPRTPAT